MKEIQHTILYCVFARTLVILFYYNSGTLIYYGSGSDFLTSYGSGSGSTQQKVTVPTNPVPQHCRRGRKNSPKARQLAEDRLLPGLQWSQHSRRQLFRTPAQTLAETNGTKVRTFTRTRYLISKWKIPFRMHCINAHGTGTGCKKNGYPSTESSTAGH